MCGLSLQSGALEEDQCCKNLDYGFLGVRWWCVWGGQKGFWGTMGTRTGVRGSQDTELWGGGVALRKGRAESWSYRPLWQNYH